MATLVLKAEDFISGPEVRRLLNINKDQLTKLKNSGEVTVQQLPGMHPRFLRSEIEQLAELSVRHAGRPPDKALRDLVAERLSPDYCKPEVATA